VRRAGFTDVRSRPHHHPDLGYRELAQHVEARLAAAVETPDGGRDQLLASAARSAWMWARSGRGDFTQCWFETTATDPSTSG
jgi:hypothetical protein